VAPVWAKPQAVTLDNTNCYNGGFFMRNKYCVTIDRCNCNE